MGLFVYECESCGHVEEHVYTSWRNRPDILECAECGQLRARHIIAPHGGDNHPIRGLLEECSWLNDHAGMVSQEHHEGMKGNARYRGSVMTTRQQFSDYLKVKGIREKPGFSNRTEV